jgi:hypothetical protein
MEPELFSILGRWDPAGHELVLKTADRRARQRFSEFDSIPHEFQSELILAEVLRFIARTDEFTPTLASQLASYSIARVEE